MKEKRVKMETAQEWRTYVEIENSMPLRQNGKGRRTRSCVNFRRTPLTIGPGESSPHHRTDIDYGDDPSRTIVV